MLNNYENGLIKSKNISVKNLSLLFESYWRELVAFFNFRFLFYPTNLKLLSEYHCLYMTN